MKAVALLALVFCAHGAFAARNLQQLPTLGNAASPTSAAPAPGPLSASCALAYLQNAGDFTLLLEAVQAASEASLLESILDSSAERATLFAPTDAGIEKGLAAANIKPEDLIANADLLTSILQYHITPSQLSPADLKDGFSFNTLYEVNTVAQSVAIQGNGVTATVKAAASSAPIIGQATACNFNIYPIDGVLLFNSS